MSRKAEPWGGYELVRNARKHIDELEREIREYFLTQPVSSEGTVDESTGDYVVRAILLESPPSSLSTTIKDAVSNLRAPLDHMWRRLMHPDGGGANARKTYFHVYASESEFRLKQREVRGSRADLVAALETVRPYRGGTTNLWILEELDNHQKHVDLVPAIGCISQSSIDCAGFSVESEFEELRHPPSLMLTLNHDELIAPVTSGAELFRMRGVSRAVGEATYSSSNFSIVLADVPALFDLRGREVVGLLRCIADDVDRVISTFRALRPDLLRQPTSHPRT